MRILELHLKSFGKFTDKHIYFPEQLEVIYGENEYGKSTIYAFIKAMLFGLERGRGRAAANDLFSRYEPWDHPNDYAGMMRFSCGDRVFRLERQFDRYGKRASLICEDDGEELSVENGDLDMLLGGMTMSSFENIAAIGQLTAKPGESLAAQLKNYAANYYETGSEDIDLNGALEQLGEKRKLLEKKQKELRGKRERSVDNLENQKRYVDKEIEDLAKKLAESKNRIHLFQMEMDELKGVFQKAEDPMTRKQQLLKEEQEDPLQKLDILGQRKPEQKTQTEKSRMQRSQLQKSEKKGSILLSLLAFLVGTILFFLPFEEPLVRVVASLLIGVGFFGALRAAGLIKKRTQNTPQEGEKSKEDEGQEANVMDEKTRHQLAELESKIKKCKWEMEHFREERREKCQERDNLSEKIAEAELPGEEDARLWEKMSALELAKEKLSEAASEMIRSSGQRFNKRASEILCAVTQGKYHHLLVEEGLKMTVLYEGRRIPIERLSRGTMEQIYFAIRMAALDLMYEEELPVIFDDAFVFYDEKRLKSTLKWLSEQSRQVIIFSCQTRENRWKDEVL